MSKTWMDSMNWLPFKAGAEVPAFGVMVDNGVAVVAERMILQTRATQSLGERPIWINSPVLVAANGYGSCTNGLAGPTYVAYDTGDGTPAIGETWGPVASSFKIRKGLPGFKVLKAGASGVVWAVYEPGAPSYYGKLDDALTAGSSQTMSVYYLSGATWTDRLINATVYAPPLLSSGSIATGKWITAAWKEQSRRLEVVSAEC